MSQTSRIRDSGVDLSWYDANNQIWTVQQANVRGQKADDNRQGIVHVRPQTTPQTSASQSHHGNRNGTPLTEIEIQVNL